MIAAGLLLSRSAFLGACYWLSLSAPTILSDDTLLVSAPSSDPLAARGNPLTTETVETIWKEWSTKVRARVDRCLDDDPTLTGPLIRLAFHDAATLEQTISSQGGVATTTGGPNGSIVYETDRPANSRLGRPIRAATNIFEESRGLLNASTTDTGKTTLSSSLADVIALAGAQAVQHAGGPHISIRLGRADTDTADPLLLRTPLQKSTDRSLVDTTLPSAALDSDGLCLYFKRLGLTEEEFVALSGVHGLGRHVTLLDMPKACLKNLTAQCIEDAPVSLPFVTASVDVFDNSYFQALLDWYHRDITGPGQVAFLPTDVAMVVDRGLRRHVERLAHDEARFSKIYTRAYQKLVDTTATTKGRY